ncbi:hypothetical protein [Virgisporangium aurantiacum]|uniref:Uncharacterized protein n=1 Tax=Virgisporangium aurantiacum TaxID=175570 RepID=A0A8J3ZFF8_9ACTN|nr:hypothetical protein [Virgisporangium aurantiacum]GIJ61818.1 hypothetical protein Vau01_093340 [Virgisporangium aurantiacum]
MSSTAYIAIGVMGGAVIAGVFSVLVVLVGHRTSQRKAHLERAVEKHLERYERVFVAARTAQDSLRNYLRISGRVDDRSDPFLFQLLAIATESVNEFCVSVTWTHNPGMLYLDIKLEEKCLSVRDLLLGWLAVRRVHWGEVATVRRTEQYEPIPLDQVPNLRLGDYRELRLETRRLVLSSAEDISRLRQIDKLLSAVIADLKAVVAY